MTRFRHLAASGAVLVAFLALHGCLAEAALIGGIVQTAANAPGSQVVAPTSVPNGSPATAGGDTQASAPSQTKPGAGASPEAPQVALVLDGYELRPLISPGGASLEFLPRLKNTGSQATSYLDSAMECLDPQVKVTGKVSYLPINPGQTRSSDRYHVALPGGFILAIAGDMPKGHVVAFTLTLEDTSGRKATVPGSLTLP